MGDQKLDENHLVSDKLLQHCKSITAIFFLQVRTNNVKFTFGIDDTTYMGSLQRESSKANRTCDTKYTISVVFFFFGGGAKTSSISLM